MTNFPTYAQVVLDGFSETVIPNHLRSEFDDGYVRQDGRISAYRQERKVNIYVCSRDDLNQFRCWWHEDLRNGSRFFKWFDPIANQDVRARFVGNLDITPSQKVLAGTKFKISTTIESWGCCVENVSAPAPAPQTNWYAYNSASGFCELNFAGTPTYSTYWACMAANAPAPAPAPTPGPSPSPAPSPSPSPSPSPAPSPSPSPPPSPPAPAPAPIPGGGGESTEEQ